MFELINYHPALWLLISSIFMLLSIRRYQLIFNISAIFFPIVALTTLHMIKDSGEIGYFGFTFIIIKTHFHSKLFAYAFLVALLIGVFSALSHRHYREIILGNFACASALVAVYSGDFLMLFFATESLMILSFIMIFVGNGAYAKQAAIRYFMMHLISGTLFLLGIILLSAISDQREIISITQYLSSYNAHLLSSILIISALCINAAIFPLSTWMSDAYPEAKSSGTLFLLSYTSKVALFSLILLFPGAHILYYLGIITMIYGCVYSLIETNLRRIICFLTISHAGFSLICISNGSEDILNAISVIILFKIIAQAVLLSSISTLIENLGIKYVGDISKLPKQFRYIPVAISLSVFVILSGPFSGTFFVKDLITKHIGDDIGYILYLITSSTIPIALTIKAFIGKNHKITIHKSKNKYYFMGMLTNFLALLISSFVITKYLTNELNIKHIFSIDTILNQSLFIISSLILSYFFTYRRNIEPSICLNTDFLYRQLIFACDFNLSQYTRYFKFNTNINISDTAKNFLSPYITISRSILILFLILMVIFGQNIYN